MNIIQYYIKKNKEYKNLSKANEYKLQNYLDSAKNLILRDINYLNLKEKMDCYTKENYDVLMLMQYYNSSTINPAIYDEFCHKLRLILYSKFLLEIYKDIVSNGLSKQLYMHPILYQNYCCNLKTWALEQDFLCDGELIWFVSELGINNL